MSKLRLLEYYNKMCRHNIVLDFQGTISHEMLVVMAEMLRGKFVYEYGNAHFIKDVFSIFIELAQNISNYSAERVKLNGDDLGIGSGIIVVSEKDRVYTVTSGNLVKCSAVSGILAQCDRINSMTPDKLKQYYKEKIKSPRRDGRAGAGVGLISIARKACDRISYDVVPVDDKLSFLVISVQVKDSRESVISAASPAYAAQGAPAVN